MDRSFASLSRLFEVAYRRERQYSTLVRNFCCGGPFYPMLVILTIDTAHAANMF